MMFPFRDLREFISELEKQGQLKKIATEVDWNLEIGAIMRKVLDSEGPAVLFPKVKGYSSGFSFFSGTLGTFPRYAIAMGLPPAARVHEITKAYRERVRTPVRPILVNRKDAPCKENILKGAVFDHPWSGVHGVIVSMKPRFTGHVQRVAHAIWGSEVGYHLDYIFVVDDDIVPTNLNEVLWAICTRCKPDRDIYIYRGEQASALWPCLTPEERKMGLGARALIDATFPAEWPADWVPMVSDWWDFPEEVLRTPLTGL
ncbi:MAG: hypothetical protein ACE5JU_14945 [Candidatus Binatia bacterium]